MTPFTMDQWVILILVFLLGLLIGMWLMAGNKWKRRYREEVTRREALEREYKNREATNIAARTQADREQADRAQSDTARPL